MVVIGTTSQWEGSSCAPQPILIYPACNFPVIYFVSICPVSTIVEMSAADRRGNARERRTLMRCGWIRGDRGWPRLSDYDMFNTRPMCVSPAFGGGKRAKIFPSHIYCHASLLLFFFSLTHLQSPFRDRAHYSDSATQSCPSRYPLFL